MATSSPRANPRGAPHERGAPPPALSRRALLTAAGLTGLGASVALTGCGATGASGGQSVQVWDLFSGADGANMVAMLEKAAVPTGYQLDHVTLAWGSPYYTKLAMASAGGRPPQTAIMHLSRLGGYAPGGLLDPWDLDLLSEFGVSHSDFAPALWERCLFEGQLYALPLDTHPFILFYNTDLCGQAGLLADDGTLAPIDSPDAMIAAHNALVKVTGADGVAYGFLGDAAQAWRLFWGLYGQTGATYTFADNQRAEFDSAKALDVLGFMQNLVSQPGGAKSMDYGSALTSFGNGKSGILFSGEWEMPGIVKQLGSEKLDAVPMPTMFGTPANYADSHSWVLPRQGNRDEGQKRATYQLISNVLKDALTWAQAGHIPAYLPVQKTPEYQALLPQAHYAAAGDIVYLDPQNWFAGAGSDFQNQMCQPMNQMMRGEQDAQTTLDQMTAALTTMLSVPNPA
ncbi:extracellular solute-binding protein [Micrococcales bacterium 31B]|nr:extracellular solute-binding protein [Micrococcales bacterium 31B]